jgi:hypothetical protein
MEFPKSTFSIFIISILILFSNSSTGQITVYNNFGSGHDGWDYNYGLGWTISGYDVAQQYGVEQATGFESASDGYLSDIWMAISYVPINSQPDTVIVRITENPSGLPPDTSNILEEWTLTSFSSWSQWNTPIHLVGNGNTELLEGQSYWIWAIGKETTWCMWCLNEDPSYTAPHTIRREDEDWLSISNETASAFRVDVSLTSGITVDADNESSNNSLSQNFPNPFSSSTKISYFVENSSFVNLRVYDVFGREVQTLINEFQQSGNHSIELNGNHLTTGIYFVKLHAGNQFVDMKKISFVE